MRREVYVVCIILISILFLTQIGIVQADEDGHSHFRFAHISYKVISTNTAEFTFTAAFRRCGYPGSDADGCPAVGDVITEWIGGTDLCFGDGQCTSWLNFKVFGINKQEDWLIGRALDPSNSSKETITHVYNGPGPFTAFTDSCCRTFDSRHINNPSGYYRVEAIVNFINNTDNPKSLLPPIVNCTSNSESGCRFRVVTIDGDGRQLQFRLANSSEAGWGFRQPGPPFATNAASIGLNTGEYTWNTTGAQLNPNGETLYSTQVIIEEKDNQNNTISKSALDFFIRLVPPEEVITDKVIKVPVRWCAAEGVLDNVDQELLDRLACVNDNIFNTQSKLQFISPLGGTSLEHFPTIGSEFKILGDNNKDILKAERACREKWETQALQVTGIVAVLVDEIEGNSLGKGGGGCIFGNVGTQLICNRVWIEKDASKCNSPIIGIHHNVGKVLGQELAHALALTHGDGKDDDGTDGLDEDSDGSGCTPMDPETGKVLKDKLPDTDTPDCPDGPSPYKGKTNLMDYSSIGFFGIGPIHPHFHLPLIPHQNFYQDHSVFLSDLQADRLRTQALLIPDRIVDPITPPLGSARVSELGNVPIGEEFIDINISSVSVDPETETTTFALSTLGNLPENIANLNFFFVANLDNNISTGGLPSTIGIPSSSQGIELVGAVKVNVNNGIPQTNATLWKFNTPTGQFVQVVDQSIKGKVDPVIIEGILPADSDLPSSSRSGQIIRIEIPNAVLGNINTTAFSIETTAENPNTGATDNMVAEMTFEVPTYPECQVTPLDTVLDSTVIVSASDLPPNSQVEVFLGTEQIATGLTDSAGSANISFQVPENTSTGTRPVRVGKIGTAISASCHVNLQGPPRFDVPPSPAVGNTFIAYIGATLNFTIQASDPDENDTVALGAIGLPTGSSFPIPSAANIVNTTFFWTPSVGQEGDYVVVFTAADNRGLSAPPHSIIIRVVAKRLGDLDGDNDIDSTDYQIFRTTLGKCTGQTGFIPEADYDGDGCVTYADYKIWYGYYKNQ